MASDGRGLLDMLLSVLKVVVALLLLQGMVMLQIVDVLASGTVRVDLAVGFNFGVEGLIQVAELQLFLLGRIQELLLGTGGSWI